MPDPLTDHHEPCELVFDVTKPVEGVEFLGLLDRTSEPGNKLTGLFDWQCRGCATPNRDATVVEPQQAFLSRWVCRQCERVTIVRFRARPSADWVAGHALAITGKALCHLAENELMADAAVTEHRTQKQANQRLFAWIVIPALLALIMLGLSDIRRLAHSSAAIEARRQLTPPAGALSRLLGSWVSEEGAHRLTFTHIDPVSLKGAGVQFSGNHRPGDRFWFDVTHQDARGEQLDIRPWREDLGHAPEVSLYIPSKGRTLTWIDIESAKPIFRVYRRVDD